MQESKVSENLEEIGKVESISDGICRVVGLKQIGIDTVISFQSGCRGLIIDYSELSCHAIVVGDYTTIKKGDYVKILQDELKVPAGEKLLGRIINPLGEPMDGKGKIEADRSISIENKAKNVFERDLINSQIVTGHLMIDSQIPIGRGQRELIIGEKRIGKEEVAVATMINQSINKSNVIVVYVTIGSQTAFIKRVVEKLVVNKAINNTIVVLGMASDPASLNYLSPLTGVSIAEDFASQGKDVLVIFDNLTRHARTYRQISLLLKRSPGREAYPGDIFYLHSRLLERCGKFNQKAGGGSITAIPLVETVSEDITDYITTNLMSITDGHILFTKALYHQGRRPAISTELSVSRIGGKAQSKNLRELSNDLKMVIGKYAELETLTNFGTELQEDTRKIIERGKRIFALLNQEQDSNFGIDEQCFIIYLLLSEHIFKWPAETMDVFRKALVKFLKSEKIASKIKDLDQKDKIETEKVYEEVIQMYIDDPETLQPLEENTNPADKESINDILSKMDKNK
ncbi:MAG: F0F1 ATP synthase subunit alpha [Chloroflexi bacterium]|nr:F0F1 ATP synthase subunit alpha [Chloroflexota bacterium]